MSYNLVQFISYLHVILCLPKFCFFVLQLNLKILSEMTNSVDPDHPPDEVIFVPMLCVQFCVVIVCS